MSKRGDDQRLFLLVGGGAANATAAQTLREAGFKGRILVVSKEGVLPYDRPKLSKAMTIEASKILLRQPEFYDKYDIEFKLNTEVTELDADAKTATLSNGETVKYDAVLVATGGSPRTLPLEGFNSPNVVPLRDIGEAHNIAQATKGKRVVIVGTSFIGMEVASSIVKEATSVICIGMEKVAFERVLGAEVGGAIQKLHVSNKVDFRMEAVVGELKVTDGLVSSVIVKGTGEELPCDFVVVGAGVVPATKFIKPGSTIKLDDREKSILCDKVCCFTISLSFAFPFFSFSSTNQR
jgi:NAD(P)H-nitrite reductase large subunit